MGDGPERGRVMVTGASRGIGRELARVFAREGHPLVLVARSGDELDALARELRERHDVDAEAVPYDLAVPGAGERLHAELAARGTVVEVLVNNAGIGSWGAFVEGDLARHLDEVRVNVLALTELTGLFLPEMVDRGRGGVLNVASTAAFQPGPLMAVYYATKAYVLHFSEALSEELRGTDVTITALCPGPTETSFQDRAGMGDLPLLSLGMADAREVAEAGYRAFRLGRRVVVPGMLDRLGAFLIRFAPRRTAAAIVRRLQEKREPAER